MNVVSIFHNDVTHILQPEVPKYTSQSCYFGVQIVAIGTF